MEKIADDEAAVLDAVEAILALGSPVSWGADISSAPSALLLALLAACGQDPVYVPGKTVNRMSGAYRGEAKTDARDAYVIAETVRHRGDFAPIEVPAQIAADLALLTAHRSDLVADRVRMINRLREVLTGIFPALERAFDYSSSKGALTLLTGYQTPERIRRIGQARLNRWLVKRGMRIDRAGAIAEKAVDAAKAQLTELPGQDVAARIVAEITAALLSLDERIARLDKDIRATFAAHPQAAIIESTTLTGAESAGSPTASPALEGELWRTNSGPTFSGTARFGDLAGFALKKCLSVPVRNRSSVNPRHLSRRDLEQYPLGAAAAPVLRRDAAAPGAVLIVRCHRTDI